MVACFDYIKAKRPEAALVEQVPHVVRNKKLKRSIYDKWITTSLDLNFKHWHG